MQLIGTGKQRAAKSSRISVENQPLTYASWNANVTGDDLDTVNFSSFVNDGSSNGNSYSEGILGIVKCDLDFGGDWDAGTNAFDDQPPGLYPRDDLDNLEFDISVPDGLTGWFFGFARIRTAKNGGEVKNKVTFSCTGMNQGIFSYPSGDA